VGDGVADCVKRGKAAGVVATEDPDGDRVVDGATRYRARVPDPAGEAAVWAGCPAEGICSDLDDDLARVSAWDRALLLFSPENSKEL
jgi:hypothetical protein